MSPFRRSLGQTPKRALLPALTHVLRTVLSSTVALPWISPHQDSQSVELVRIGQFYSIHTTHGNHPSNGSDGRTVVVSMVVPELCDLWQTTLPLQRCGYLTCGTGRLKCSISCPEVLRLKADSCKVHGPDLAHSQCLVYVGNCDCQGSDSCCTRF